MHTTINEIIRRANNGEVVIIDLDGNLDELFNWLESYKDVCVYKGEYTFNRTWRAEIDKIADVIWVYDNNLRQYNRKVS
jgi:hypothetical protein